MDDDALIYLINSTGLKSVPNPKNYQLVEDSLEVAPTILRMSNPSFPLSIFIQKAFVFNITAIDPLGEICWDILEVEVKPSISWFIKILG